MIKQRLQRRINAVVIGVSTGGPAALEKVFASMSAPLPVPVLVVQHMPASFTGMLAERLNRVATARVVEASTGVVPEPGTIYIAPGGHHMSMVDTTTEPQIRLNTLPPVNSCRPAVDVLFKATAEIWGPNQLAVVMTGMGSDGLAGCQQLARHGVEIFVQDEASSVVWGMPGAVSRAGLATRTVTLERLGAAIEERVHSTPQLGQAMTQRQWERRRRATDNDPKPDSISNRLKKQGLVVPNTDTQTPQSPRAAAAEAARRAREAVESTRRGMRSAE